MMTSLPLKPTILGAICAFGLSVSSFAGTAVELHQGWALQSACSLRARPEQIAAAGFDTSGWIKTTVPSTVLAAQAAAGQVADPFFADNLRKIPGTDYPDRAELRQSSHVAAKPLSMWLVVSL